MPDIRLNALTEARAIADDVAAHWFSQAMAAKNDGDEDSATACFQRGNVASVITRKIQDLIGT